jgi:pimeloyl-ACP methyl ester carboxylesterase
MKSTMQLQDGRVLAYAEYGDPQGTPVFFFHGTPGSCLFRPPDDVTKRLKVRLICAERPGYGDSNFQPNRRLLDWPRDVTSLADALKIDKFAIAGHSGGGPHTLACAYALPNRVTAAVILSGAGPVDAPGATDGMAFVNWLGFKFGQYLPWRVGYALTWWFFREIVADPTKAIDRDLDTRPAADNEILNIPEIRELCIKSDVEAYKHGLPAFAWDVRLITRPWGFKLEEIKVPVHFWHGTLDNSTTMAMARYMAEKTPSGKLTVCDGEAHMLLIPHWEEILTTLIRMSASA